MLRFRRAGDASHVLVFLSSWFWRLELSNPILTSLGCFGFGLTLLGITISQWWSLFFHEVGSSSTSSEDNLAFGIWIFFCDGSIWLHLSQHQSFVVMASFSRVESFL